MVRDYYNFAVKNLITGKTEVICYQAYSEQEAYDMLFREHPAFEWQDFEIELLDVEAAI